MMWRARAAGVVALLAAAAEAGSGRGTMTTITVINEWDGGMSHSDLNVKIHGEGVGGCDIVMHPANSSGPTEDDSSCKCLWGTVNYELTVWIPAVKEDAQPGRTSVKDGPSGNSSQPDALPFCSDTRGLGNCYGGPYTCTIGADKLCHCE